MKTNESGEAELFTGTSLPKRIQVRAREGSNDPVQAVEPRMTEAGECELVVVEWRRVRVRVQGLEFPWGHVMERILVEGEQLEPGVDPIRSTIWWPRADGAEMVFDTRLPPGRWTFRPADPEAITFPEGVVEVEGPGDPIEVVLRAELGPQVGR